jgi:sarcosine oxidase subunit beta
VIVADPTVADPILDRVPDRASVVVLGGGVVGVSTAFHLAEAGVRDVLLLERDALGSGSTSRAAGGVRAQFSDELNVRLGARSLELLGRFGDRPGAEIDLHRVGYLFLLSRPEDVRHFEASIALQNRLGVPSRLLTVEQAQRLAPQVRPDGLLAAAFSPADGHCTPEAVVLGYASAARRLGARLVTGCTVTGVEVRGGEVRAVTTDRGRVQTGTVVCAAGAWSAALADSAGVDLPVVPLRRQVVVTGPLAGLPDHLPMTIEFATSLYFHREGRGLLVGMSDPDERPGFRLDNDDAWLPRLAQAVQRRAPGLLDAGIAHGWAGLYEMTPDHNALVGEAPDVSRFLYATGFSGHGFLMGPAIGEVVRDLVLGRDPFVDVSPLDARRFSAGADRPEINVV